MTTLKQIAIEYGISKSTARRWLIECMPEIVNGSRIDLDAVQMQQLAHFIETHKTAAIRNNTNNTDSMNSSHRTEEQFNGAVGADSEAPMLKLNIELEIENAQLKIKCDMLEDQISELKTTIKALENKRDDLIEDNKDLYGQLQAAKSTPVSLWTRLKHRLLPDGKR